MPNSRRKEPIRGGMPRQDALRAFREAVNQPDAKNAADRRTSPGLRLLNELLRDPITSDEASALLDVLHGRRRRKDLLEWLRGEPTAWADFVARCQAREANEEWGRRKAAFR